MKEQSWNRAARTSGIDSLVQYFYGPYGFIPGAISTEEDSLIILDEPARAAEKGEAVTTEYRESMMGRLEKGLCAAGTDRGHL